jgi:hypothetical protein
VDQYLNAIPKTLKLLQENIRKALWVIDLGNNFISGTPIAQEE